MLKTPKSKFDMSKTHKSKFNKGLKYAQNT